MSKKPKLSRTDLRIAMGWIRDYNDPAFSPKTPLEMKKLVEDMWEVEIEDIADVEEFFTDVEIYEDYEYDRDKYK